MGVRVCVLASGSTGNATLVSDGRTHLLLDCGLVACETERRLREVGIGPAELAGILITHAHIDHFRSAGTMHRRHGVTVYVDPAADRAIRQRRANGSYSRLVNTQPIPETIGTFRVRPFLTNHTVWGGRPLGFVLAADGVRVGLVTDTGTVSAEAVKILRGCQVLVTEANYDPDILNAKLENPRFAADWHYLKWVASDEGHLSNGQCAELLEATVTDQTRHIFLAHISENHSDPRRDNNSYERAHRAVREYFSQRRLKLPTVHRTYRRDATEGQASEVVTAG